jgi:hypothetical protein
LTNPVGILIVAVTAAIGLLYYFRDSLFVAGDGVTTLGDLFRALWAITTETFTAMWQAAQAFFAPLMELARPVIETVLGWFKNFGDGVDLTFRGIVTAVAKYYDTLIGIGVGAVKAFIAAWGAFPGAFTDIILRAVNAGIQLIQDFVNGAIGLLNNLIGAFNALGANELTRALGVNFTSLTNIATVEFGKIENKYAGGFAKLGTDTKDAFLEGFNGSNGLVGAVNKVFDRAAEIGKARLDAAKATAKADAALGDPLRGSGPSRIRTLIDPQAAKDTAKSADQLKNSLTGLRSGIDPLFAAQERLRTGTATLDKAYKAGLITLKERNTVLGQLKASVAADIANIDKKATDDATRSVEKHAGALGKINRELDSEIGRLGQLKPQREIQQQLDQYENDLLSKKIKLTAEEKNVLRDKLITIQAMKLVQQQLDSIYDETLGKEIELKASVLATAEAYKQGLISADAYGNRLVKLQTQIANVKLEAGNGGFAEVLSASLGKVVESYKGLLAGLSDSFGTFFTSLNTGFGDAIGNAIVKGENLGVALRSVAANAVSKLISSLVQLGVQYLITQALGVGMATTTAGAQIAGAGAASAAQVAGTATATSAAIAGTTAQTTAAITGATSTAAAQVAATGVATGAAVAGMATTTTASVASATATGAAWAPAAAFASIGSFGTAALLGLAGIAAVIALVSKGFKDGGYTGSGGVSDVAGVVHGKEFVMNADATAKNRRLLEAMNSGASLSRLVPGYMTGGYVEPSYSAQRPAMSPASNETTARGKRSEAPSSRKVEVHLNISASDANSFVKSEGQVAAAAARAIQRGTRNL